MNSCRRFKEFLVLCSAFAWMMTLAIPMTGCKAKTVPPRLVFDDANANSYGHGNVEVTFRVTYPDGTAPALSVLPSRDLSSLLTIREDGQPLSHLEGFSTSVVNSKIVSMRVLLLLDLSGSVATSLEELKKSAISFVRSTLGQGADLEVAIGSFDGSESAVKVLDFTSSTEKLVQAIQSLNPGRDPSTNLYGALVDGYRFLKNSTRAGDQKKIIRKAMVVFTDGKDQAGRVTRKAAIDAINSAKTDREFRGVMAVAVGSEIDVPFLSVFGAEGAGYYLAPDDRKLALEFQKISAELNKIAKSYYTVRICSPKRHGTHFVNLYANGDLQESAKATLNVEFNADQFGAGCDVNDESQWNQPGAGAGKSAAVLDNAQMARARQFFTRFSLFNAAVRFHDKVAKPENGFIWNFSPYTESSPVACHLEFDADAEEIQALETMRVVRYQSFNGWYNDVNRPFHGVFFVLESERKGFYRLYCAAMDDMPRVTGGSTDPELPTTYSFDQFELDFSN